MGQVEISFVNDNKAIFDSQENERDALPNLRRWLTGVWHLQTADCTPQTADCRLQTADYRPQIADCKLKDTKNLPNKGDTIKNITSCESEKVAWEPGWYFCAKLHWAHFQNAVGYQPRPQGFSLKKWVGREKALVSAGHVSSRTP